DVARPLLLAGVVPESAARLALGERPGQPGGDEVVGALGKVKLELAIEVARVAVGAEEVAEAAKPGHGKLLSRENVASGVAEHTPHAFGEARPAFLFGGELLAALRRDGVEARIAILFRHSPRGAHPASLLHAVQGRVERALFDTEQVGRRLLNARGDGVAVERTARGERLEDEEVERTLQDVVLRARHVGGVGRRGSM